MNAKLSTLAIATLLITAPSLAVELIGQAESNNKQSIVAEVNGVIKSAVLEPGDNVASNMLLASIKTQSFDFELAKKQANIELAQAELKLKSATFERFQELVNKNSLSKNDLDVAKADYLNAKANLSLAQIELQEAKQNLSDTQITSSINGYVVSRNTEVGAWVNQGDLLYQLVNIDTLTITLMASEHDIKSLKVGQPIQLWPETHPERKVTSNITRIGVEMDANTHAYPIEIDIENPDYTLKPGMSFYGSTRISNQ